MSIDTFLLSADTTDLDYPEVRPTLDLNFARVKALDPRITFTRASGGSYVGADGLIKYAGVNEARFDHDPYTGESLGLLVEEARTNLFTRSEEFNLWTQANLTAIPGSSISPEGKLNATNLVETNISNAHFVSRGVGTVTSGITYIVSCFAKSTNPNRFFSIIYETSSLFGGDFPRASFNLQTGTLITQTLGTASIQDYGNGWYRCSISATPTATGTLTIQLRLQDQANAVGMTGFYTGDGTSGLYIWGAQLEAGAFATSYIPTEGSTRTRAADNASITGKNFREWYRQDEGSVFVRHKTFLESNPFNRVFALIDSTFNNAYAIYYPATNNRIDGLKTVSGTTNFISGSTSSNKHNIFNNTVLSYDGSTTNITTNGGAISSSTTPGNLNLNRLIIGASEFIIGHYIHISRLTYYPKRLPNQQLQALTR